MFLSDLNSDTFPYRTYSEYIYIEHKHLLPNAYQIKADRHWLSSIFEDARLQKPLNHLSLGNIQASLVEFVDRNGSLVWSSVVETRNSLGNNARMAPGQLLYELDQRPSNFAVRILLIHLLPRCKHISRLDASDNKAFMDIVGARYGVNPAFSIDHLAEKMLDEGQGKHLDRLQVLPSEKKSFVELKHPQKGSISTLVVDAVGTTKKSKPWQHLPIFDRIN